MRAIRTHFNNPPLLGINSEMQSLYDIEVNINFSWAKKVIAEKLTRRIQLPYYIMSKKYVYGNV